MKLPKIGLRIIKTALATFLSCLFAYIRNQNPILIVITAIICMKNTKDLMYSESKNRLIGTIIGTVWSIVIILLIRKEWVETHSILYYTIISFALIFVIYSLVLFKLESSVTMACVVFFSIVLNHINDSNPLLYGLQRFIDTTTGIAIALVLNLALPNHYEE